MMSYDLLNFGHNRMVRVYEGYAGWFSLRDRALSSIEGMRESVRKYLDWIASLLEFMGHFKKSLLACIRVRYYPLDSLVL